MTQPVIIGNASLYLGDCLEVMAGLPDASVDMILCDLPYGITACKWDTVIPFEPLWAQYRRVAKPNAAIVLTASQPFTSALVMSNVADFKYEWVWHKVQPTGHLLAKRQPMRACESVLVFYRSQPTYSPQMGVGKAIKRTGVVGGTESWGKGWAGTPRAPSGTARFPTTLLTISAGRSPAARTLHPTQKPVALMEYMIRTYTREAEVVLDNCMGSGTTGVACHETHRAFIGIEKEPRYFDIACRRIEDAQRQARLIA